MNTILKSELAFNISCPSIVIPSDCQFNQTTGIFRVAWSQLNNSVPNIDYLFTVITGKSKSLVASANQTLKIRWKTMQTPAMKRCPGVYASQKQINLVSRPDLRNSWLYGPAFLMDCNGQSFRLTKINYSINQQKFNSLKYYTYHSGNLTVYPKLPKISTNFSDTFSLASDSYQL
jgi:hypothetical protein